MKVKALIEHEGERREVNGDLVICFAINDSGIDLDKQAQEFSVQQVVIGRKLPDAVYPELISNMVVDTVGKISSGEVWAGLILHYIADMLKDKSKEIKSNWTEKDVVETLKEAAKQSDQFYGNRQN